MVDKDKKLTVADVAARLQKLFDGNIRSVGRFNPLSGKVTTLDREPALADFVDHIKGTEGVGVVPINDDSMCKWAALDIDNHGSEDGADIPIVPFEQKVNSLNLPLVACRSKSGGIHAYVFFSSPMLASKVKIVMDIWAKQLGHAGCEVFPKQSKLHRTASGKLSFGNWINLPYMGGKTTIRYAVHRGEKIGLIEFLDLAESMKTDEKKLISATVAQYNEAPPCIKCIMNNGVGEGHRNEALFNTTVFLRKAFPDDFTDRAIALNPIIFHKPLAKAELMRTVSSAGRPDYSYRCNEEPVRPNCDKTTCIASKFGISAKEYELLDTIQELPPFSGLVKYSTEPIRWELNIGGKKVSNLSTQQLLDWRIMREMIAERLMRVVPMIKPAEWERILAPMMGDVRVVDTPDDASVAGVIRLRLKEFAAKADLMDNGKSFDSRSALMRGLPCVQEMEGERCVLFRAQDFINYLKRTKSEELKGTNLWFAVRDFGVEHSKIRVREHSINVWRVPVDVITKDWAEAEPPVFTTEI